MAGAALVVYACSSVVLFGRLVLADLGGRYLGWGADPATFVWYLAWWPHAVGNGLNPLVTDLLWAPEGVNLAAGTPVPGIALLVAPVTAAVGPVVAYNVAMLLAPAVSAWGGFLLCRDVTGSFWPSLLGGYLFGFSTYTLGRMLGHLNLALVVIVPLIALLAIRRLSGTIGRPRFLAFASATLAFQLLVSTEVALTLATFGALALLGAWAIVRDRGRQLGRLGLELAAAQAIAAVAVGPYLWFALGRAFSERPIYDFYPRLFSTDVLNLLIPTVITRFGHRQGAAVAATFGGNIGEQVGYVGVPLLLLVAAFAASRAIPAPVRGYLLAALGVVIVASLGPVLSIGGREIVPLPWQLAEHVPLLRLALPGRFMLYAFLILAVAAALWLAAPGRWRAARWALAIAGVVALFPNSSSHIWATEVDTPAFFSGGAHRRLLRPGEIALVIPYGDRGASMLWQAEAGLSFRMPGGYVTVVPPESFSAWPILHTLYRGELIEGYQEELKGFLGAHGVTSIVVAEGSPGPWPELFGSLDVRPQRVGGVVLYRVPARVLSAYRDSRPGEQG